MPTIQLDCQQLTKLHKISDINLGSAVQCNCEVAQMSVRCQYLLRFESRWNPGVLLQGTAGVVVRRGVPLEVVHQLGDRLLHLYRHGCHSMLLTATLTVHTDLPTMEKHRERASVKPVSYVDYTFVQQAYINKRLNGVRVSE